MLCTYLVRRAGLQHISGYNKYTSTYLSGGDGPLVKSWRGYKGFSWIKRPGLQLAKYTVCIHATTKGYKVKGH